jgi:PPE-repeat protein
VTSPMWFAVPPEVHSTLLSTGAWRALATEYAYAATELTGLLASVQAAAWAGPSAERFVAAHQPFLFWLGEANAVAMAAAIGHESAAAGYTSALAAMPTLAELAANHAVHAVLIATNFFGVNTIPIALNEADYVRMWVQAATAMSVYQAVSAESLAATPTTSPAPQIVSAAATPAADSSFPDPTKLILQALKDFLDGLQNVAGQILPGPLGGVVVQALEAMISVVSSEFFTILAYSVLDPLIYFGPFTPALAPFLLPVGLAGLAGIAGLDATSASGPLVVGSAAPERQNWPVTTGLTLAGAGTGTPAAAPGGAPTTSPAAGASPHIAADAQGFYAVGKDPDGEGFTPTASSDAALAAAAGIAAPAGENLAAGERRSAHRAAKGRKRGPRHRFEYLEDGGRMTSAADPPAAEGVVASDGGAGTLGFAGTIPKSPVPEAQGFADLRGGDFGEATREPMLPNTWDHGE